MHQNDLFFVKFNGRPFTADCNNVTREGVAFYHQVALDIKKGNWLLTTELSKSLTQFAVIASIGYVEMVTGSVNSLSYFLARLEMNACFSR